MDGAMSDWDMMEVARCLVIHVLFASWSCLWWEGGGEDGGQAKQADCVKERPDVHSQDGGDGRENSRVHLPNAFCVIHKEPLHLVKSVLTAFIIECLNIYIFVAMFGVQEFSVIGST